MSTTSIGDLNDLFLLEDKNYFFKAVREKIQRKVYSKSFVGIDHDDVVGDVILKIVRVLDNYDSSRSKIQTFIDKVAESVIKDVFKHVCSDKHISSVNATEYVEELGIQAKDEYSYNELLCDIREFSGLDAFEKEILELKMAGYIFDEIALKVGCSKSKVAYTWKDIARKLRKVL